VSGGLQSSRRARVLAAISGLLVLAVATLAGVRLSGANFSAQTANSENSFQAAATFPAKMRFASGTYSGNNNDNRPITGVGFQPDVVIVKANGTQIAVTRTSIVPGDNTKPMTGPNALASNRIQSLDSDGFTVGNNAQVNQGGTGYTWMAFRAAAGELSVGYYFGNGAASQAVSGLGYSPEYVTVMAATAQRAVQRFEGMTRAFQFDADTGTTNRITSLDSDGFSVGNSAEVNQNGTAYGYIAMNEVPNRIDAGSYVGNNTSSDITGVGFRPDYVMVRANDTVTARQGHHRPAALGGSSSLYWPNLADSNTGILSLLADGFRVGTDSAVNANGTTYRYLAVKDGGP
jgi:hypothetical protein